MRQSEFSYPLIKFGVLGSNSVQGLLAWRLELTDFFDFLGHLVEKLRISVGLISFQNKALDDFKISPLLSPKWVSSQKSNDSGNSDMVGNVEDNGILGWKYSAPSVKSSTSNLFPNPGDDLGVIGSHNYLEAGLEASHPIPNAAGNSEASLSVNKARYVSTFSFRNIRDAFRKVFHRLNLGEIEEGNVLSSSLFWEEERSSFNNAVSGNPVKRIGTDSKDLGNIISGYPTILWFSGLLNKLVNVLLVEKVAGHSLSRRTTDGTYNLLPSKSPNGIRRNFKQVGHLRGKEVFLISRDILWHDLVSLEAL